MSVEELEGVFREAGVERSVTAVNADVRQLPFADDEFDAIVSIDAFEYFGPDVQQSVSGEGEAVVLDLLEGETGAQMGFVSGTARTR